MTSSANQNPDQLPFPDQGQAAGEMLDAISDARYRSAPEVSHPGKELARRIASGEKIPAEDINKVLHSAGVRYTELSATAEMQIPDDIPASETIPEDPEPMLAEESDSVRALKRIRPPRNSWIELSHPDHNRED